MEIPKGKEIFRLTIYLDEKTGQYGSIANGNKQTQKDMLSTLYALNHTAGELVKNIANANGGQIVPKDSYNGPPREDKKMFDI